MKYTPEGWMALEAALREEQEISDALLKALRLVLNSDMAMREEDEGKKSETLDAVRAAIAKAEGES